MSSRRRGGSPYASLNAPARRDHAGRPCREYRGVVPKVSSIAGTRCQAASRTRGRRAGTCGVPTHKSPARMRTLVVPMATGLATRRRAPRLTRAPLIRFANDKSARLTMATSDSDSRRLNRSQARQSQTTRQQFSTSHRIPSPPRNYRAILPRRRSGHRGDTATDKGCHRDKPMTHAWITSAATERAMDAQFTTFRPGR
jgi:hypothetical protein